MTQFETATFPSSRLCTKSPKLTPSLAALAAPPFQGGERFVDLEQFFVPLAKGDGREAAGGRSQTLLKSTFCAKPTSTSSPKTNACPDEHRSSRYMVIGATKSTASIPELSQGRCCFRRASMMRFLLVRIGQLEQRGFAIGFAKERESDGQIVCGEAGRHGDRSGVHQEGVQDRNAFVIHVG